MADRKSTWDSDVSESLAEIQKREGRTGTTLPIFSTVSSALAPIAGDFPPVYEFSQAPLTVKGNLVTRERATKTWRVHANVARCKGCTWTTTATSCNCIGKSYDRVYWFPFKVSDLPAGSKEP